jgi:hypothetical protein
MASDFGFKPSFAPSDADLTGTMADYITIKCVPEETTDAANKAYVDFVAGGHNWKESVQLASTVNVADLTNDLEVGDTIDGVLLVLADRVLLKDQTDPIENGIYVAGTNGTRADDMVVGSNAATASMFVQSGIVSGEVAYVCTNDKGNDIVGTNALTFITFASVICPAAGTTGQVQFTNGVAGFVAAVNNSFHFTDTASNGQLVLGQQNGLFSILGASTTSSGVDSCNLAIQTGGGSNSNGGDLELNSGDGTGVGTGGSVTIQTGAGVTGGTIDLLAGAGSISGGAVNISSGGVILTNSSSGAVSVSTGDAGSVSGNAGNVEISTGSATGSGDGGDIVLTPGTSVGGTDGIVNADGVLFATNGITATATSRLSTHQLDSSAIEMNLFGTGDRDCFIDFHSDDTNVDKSARIIRNLGVNGALDIINIGSGTTTISSETGLVKIQHNALLTNYGETETYSVYQTTAQSISHNIVTFVSWSTPTVLSAAIGTWVLSTTTVT